MYLCKVAIISHMNRLPRAPIVPISRPPKEGGGGPVREPLLFNLLTMNHILPFLQPETQAKDKTTFYPFEIGWSSLFLLESFRSLNHK